MQLERIPKTYINLQSSQYERIAARDQINFITLLLSLLK